MLVVMVISYGNACSYSYGKPFKLYLVEDSVYNFINSVIK